MVYSEIIKGNFLSRPNRFIANVIINGETEVVHVKNTGRCRELFLPGAELYLQVSDKPGRKTKYDVIAVKKGEQIINIDSQIPNKVFAEFASAGRFLTELTYIKAESTYKNSRFDFYMETKTEKIYAEVKGVTLEENRVARFPDAPTERGIKHVKDLIDASENGYTAYIIFIIQMKGIKYFEPNYAMHREFGDVLKYASENGVNIRAYDCIVDESSIFADCEIPVIL